MVSGTAFPRPPAVSFAQASSPVWGAPGDARPRNAHGGGLGPMHVPGNALVSLIPEKDFFQRCLPRVAPRLSMTIAFLQDCSCLIGFTTLLQPAGFEQLQSEPILHRGGTIHCALGRLKLEWCKRKILLGWLELELVAGVV